MPCRVLIRFLSLHETQWVDLNVRIIVGKASEIKDQNIVDSWDWFKYITAGQRAGGAGISAALAATNQPVGGAGKDDQSAASTCHIGRIV